MPDISEKEKSPLHPIQMQILTKFIFTPKAKFKDLRIKSIPTDQFTYHLQRLITLKLIYKTPEGYKLTEEGKKFVSVIDTEKAEHEVFGKRGVLLKAAVPLDKEFKKFKYLVYKRLKQPFFGYYGFHTGKVRFGETVLETAIREFYEETGLKMVHYELVGIYHQVGYKSAQKDPQQPVSSKNQKASENSLPAPIRDVYLYEFFIYKFEGELIKSNPEEGVENLFLTIEELKSKPTYPDFWNRKVNINWTHYPKYYRRYIKLLRQGKWKNTPSQVGISEFSQHKIWFVETRKVVEKW